MPNIKDERRVAFDIWGLITEVIGFGAVLYGASVAANEGWTAPDVLVSFVIGAIGLAAFVVVELFIAKEPLLDLRLFAKRVFLNASLLGYVSVIALFGAEFLMPVYLQALRGITALETGLILLPLAITGAISTVIAGRLYDKVGPRPLVGIGFGVLVINTWQAIATESRHAGELDRVLAHVARRGAGSDRADDADHGSLGRAYEATGARIVIDQCHPAGGASDRRGAVGDRAGQHAVAAGGRLATAICSTSRRSQACRPWRYAIRRQRVRLLQGLRLHTFRLLCNCRPMPRSS